MWNILFGVFVLMTFAQILGGSELIITLIMVQKVKWEMERFLAGESMYLWSLISAYMPSFPSLRFRAMIQGHRFEVSRLDGKGMRFLILYMTVSSYIIDSGPVNCDNFV